MFYIIKIVLILK